MRASAGEVRYLDRQQRKTIHLQYKQNAQVGTKGHGLDFRWSWRIGTKSNLHLIECNTTHYARKKYLGKSEFYKRHSCLYWTWGNFVVLVNNGRTKSNTVCIFRYKLFFFEKRLHMNVIIFFTEKNLGTWFPFRILYRSNASLSHVRFHFFFVLWAIGL